MSVLFENSSCEAMARSVGLKFGVGAKIDVVGVLQKLHEMTYRIIALLTGGWPCRDSSLCTTQTPPRGTAHIHGRGSQSGAGACLPNRWQPGAHREVAPWWCHSALVSAA